MVRMEKTVITGDPIDPVEQFRSAPLPVFDRIGTYEDIILEVGEGVARITINRPEVRNA